MNLRVLCACAAVLIAASGRALADEAVLVVHGVGSDPVRITFAEIRKLPAQKIHATPEHRAAGDYDCASAASVLASAGVVLGKSLRGKRMTETLVVKAADQYQVVFALPELDPEFTDKLVLLCYLKDGFALPADERPLRLVVPGEKRQARWVRQVTDFFVGQK